MSLSVSLVERKWNSNLFKENRQKGCKTGDFTCFFYGEIN